MKKLSGIAAGLATLAIGAGVAHAAGNHVATGKIEVLNAPMHQLVINHHSYRFSPKVSLNTLQQGALVKVYYHQRGGHRTAYKIVPVAS